MSGDRNGCSDNVRFWPIADGRAGRLSGASGRHDRCEVRSRPIADTSTSHSPHEERTYRRETGSESRQRAAVDNLLFKRRGKCRELPSAVQEITVMSRLMLLTGVFPLMLTACFGSDPEHTPYYPQANGDKPEIFELGSVQVCEDDVEAIRGVERFASRFGMLTHEIADPGRRIIAVFTLGEPMQAHMMVERIYRHRVRIGISTFRGYSTGIVEAARKSNFCSNSRSSPGHSSRSTPARLEHIDGVGPLLAVSGRWARRAG